MHNKRQILTNEGFGFEWDVTPNYFNKNNSESEDSDKVRHKKLKFINLSIEIRNNY